MSKRFPGAEMVKGSDGVTYIRTVETDEIEPNVRASAAQLAKRKINAAKGIRGATHGVPRHNATSSNHASRQAQNTGGNMGNQGQNQYQTGSQSFGGTSQAGPNGGQPAARSAYNQNSYQTGSQSFGDTTQGGPNGWQPATQSASFPTFGSSTNTIPNPFNFTASTNIPNPFENSNNGNMASYQPPNSSQFGGFQSSLSTLPPQSPTAPTPTHNNDMFAFGKSNAQPQQSPQQNQTPNMWNNVSSYAQPQQSPQQNQTPNMWDNVSSYAQPQQSPQQNQTPNMWNNVSSNAQPQQSPQQNQAPNMWNNVSTDLFGQSAASANQANSGNMGQSGESQPQQALSNVFGSFPSQQAKPTTNFFGSGAGSPAQAQSSEISKPSDDRMVTTPETSPQTAKEQTSNLFHMNHLPPSPSPQGGTGGPSSSNMFSFTASEKPDKAPAKVGGSLFDRVSQPSQATDQPPTNNATSRAAPENSKSIFASIPSMTPSAFNGGMSSPAKANVNNVNPSTASEAPKNIFANIAPAAPSAFMGGFTSPAKPIGNVSTSTVSETPKSVFAAFAPAASSALASSSGNTNPAKPNDEAPKPLFSWPPPSEKPKSQTSGDILPGLDAAPSQSSLTAPSLSAPSLPAPSQSSPDQPSLPASTFPTAPKAPGPQQSSAVDNLAPSVIRRSSITSTAQNTLDELQSSFESSFGEIPPCSSATTIEEDRTVRTLWRLKGLHTGVRKLHLMGHVTFETIAAYYENRKLGIIHAAGLSFEQMAGSKRKASPEEHESSSPKKAGSTASAFSSAPSTSLANGNLANGLGSLQKAWAEGSLAKLSSPKKRKADEDLEDDSERQRIKAEKADQRNRIMAGMMRAKAREAQSKGDVTYPSLASSDASETSNIFKSIVNNEDRQPTENPTKTADGNDSTSPAKQGSGMIAGPPKSLPTSNGVSHKAQDATPTPKASIGSPFANTGSPAPSSLFSKPKANSATPFSSTAAPSSLFSKPSATATTPFSSSTAPSFKPSSTNGEASPGKAHVEKPAFEPPKFDTAATTSNFMSQFVKASEASERKDKEKRKAEEYDSEEDNEADWERKYAEEQRAKKQKLEDTIKGKSAKFVPGKGFMFTDEEQSHDTSKDASSDEASSNQSSRAPSLSVFDQPSKPARKGLNMFSHLSDADSGVEGSKVGDADDEDTDSDGAENEDDHGDAEGSEASESSGVEEVLRESDASGDDEDDEDDEDDDDDDEAPETDSGMKASAPENPFTASITSKPKASTPSSGPSLFDRISKDKNGQVIRKLPPADEKKSSSFSDLSASQTDGSGMFGNSASMFESPKDSSKPFTGFDFSSTIPKAKTDLFGQSSTPKDIPKAADTDTSSGDHTWKTDSPIKFSATSAAPSVKVTSPTASKSSFGGLFGSSEKISATETPTKPTSNLFGTTSTQSPAVGFGFSIGVPAKPDTSSLLTPSDAPANDSSRATSPGASSVAESAEGSTADGGPEGAHEQSEQLDLFTKGPGEEHEEISFEVKGKALMYDEKNKDWISKGVGPLRILKHSQTGKTRILMRQDPSGRIVINAALLGSMEYKYVAPKSVRLPIATDAGKLATFIVRVGKEEDAKRLAEVLEDLKVTSD